MWECPIFISLTNEEFLYKCKQRCTNNVNASFNAFVWSLPPKEKYDGLMEVSLVINIAACLCNSTINLFKTPNKNVDSNMLREWKVINQTRIFNIEYKCQEKTKLKPKSRKSSEV